MSLLEVSDLTVRFATNDGIVTAVTGVSYSVEEGQTLGIVGESGSGKSVSTSAILGLLPRRARAEISGSVRFAGEELLGAGERRLRRLRGADIGLVFQDPLSSLHPQLRVGAQIAEAIRAHDAVPAKAARARARTLLADVGLADAARVVEAYPHQLSGGMRQRAMIAMALANGPRLLIADEPTTALDVTVQAQILALIKRLQAELGMAVILITHDLGVVAKVTDRVAVMYGGRIVEEASTRALFRDPGHPYTWGLLDSLARVDDAGGDLRPIPGNPPSMLAPPSGCAFHPRCAHARGARHAEVVPVLTEESGGDHRVACLLDASQRRALRQARA